MYICTYFRIPNENYSPHGKVVVQHYIERSGEGLCALERRWRKHFLDTMRPKFLPPLWSVEHQVGIARIFYTLMNFELNYLGTYQSCLS